MVAGLFMDFDGCSSVFALLGGTLLFFRLLGVLCVLNWLVCMRSGVRASDVPVLGCLACCEFMF